MINAVNQLKLKNIILKHYKNEIVLIQVRGIISTNIRLSNTRIIINKLNITLKERRDKK